MSTLQPAVTLDARHTGQLVQVPSFDGPTIEGHLKAVSHNPQHRVSMLVLDLTDNARQMLHMPAVLRLNSGAGLAVHLPWMKQVVLTPAGMVPSLD